MGTQVPGLRFSAQGYAFDLLRPVGESLRISSQNNDGLIDPCLPQREVAPTDL